MDNMELYNQGREVPASAKKAFDNGTFKGTDINTMWRIKKLTEMFGPCGIGWYTEVLRETYEDHGNGNIMTIVDLNLYFKFKDEWSKPVYGTGGNMLMRTLKDGRLKFSDEGYKMAYSDALSVACKAIGIAADVYYEKDTSSKYAAYYEQQPAGASAAPPPPTGAAQQQSVQRNRSGLITAEQVRYIKTVCSSDKIKLLCAKYKVAQLADMNKLSAQVVIKQLEKRENKEEASK